VFFFKVLYRVPYHIEYAVLFMQVPVPTTAVLFKYRVPTRATTAQN